MTDPTTPSPTAADVTRGVATVARLVPGGGHVDHLAAYAHGLRTGLARSPRYSVLPAAYRRALLAEVEARLAEEEPAVGPVWTLDADGSLDTWSRITPDPGTDPSRHWHQDGGDVHETWLALTTIGVVTPASYTATGQPPCSS